MATPTPEKVTHRSYTCSVCRLEAFPAYRITTYAGNAKYRCWGCLTVKMRDAYREAHPDEFRPTPPPATCRCGRTLHPWQGRENILYICDGCNRPRQICRCEKENA